MFRTLNLLHLSFNFWRSAFVMKRFNNHILLVRDMSQRTIKPTRRPVWPYKKTCVTLQEDLCDQQRHVYPPSMARILVYSSLDSLEAVESTCDQQRLWSACANAQADLSLRCSHMSYCRFCRALAQLWYDYIKLTPSYCLLPSKIIVHCRPISYFGHFCVELICL